MKKKPSLLLVIVFGLILLYLFLFGLGLWLILMVEKKKVIRNIIYKLLTIDHILSKCISYFFLGLALIFFFFFFGENTNHIKC